jgi:hypothetical protein
MKALAIDGARVALFGLILVLCAAPATWSQMAPMGMPINTTIVIAKPAPGQIFGNKPVVTMGVGSKEYKFVLTDAYVDDRRIRWPDIWQQVRQYRPNFLMQGPHTDEIEHLEPGEMMTVKGMYAPLDRTFEIIFVQAGKGRFEPKEHY